MAPKIENFSSGGHQVTLEIYEPASAGKHPAVLILHGTFGLVPQYRPDIVSFADALVANGISATIPHFLESTPGARPGIGLLELIPRHLPTWKQACRDAFNSIAKDAQFDVAHLGTIGFSLGGHLALSLAMAPPAGTGVRCVVDFFGPTTNPALDNGYSKLPPVLILHGTDDHLVFPSESEHLITQLEAAGKKKDQDYVFKSFKDEGHGFKSGALKESRDATVDFMLKRL